MRWSPFSRDRPAFRVDPHVQNRGRTDALTYRRRRTRTQLPVQTMRPHSALQCQTSQTDLVALPQGTKPATDPSHTVWKPALSFWSKDNPSQTTRIPSNIRPVGMLKLNVGLHFLSRGKPESFITTNNPTNLFRTVGLLLVENDIFKFSSTTG
jgi:hypothetical protein